MLKISDSSELGFPIHLPRPIRANSAWTVAEGFVRPTITSKELNEELAEITGVASEEFILSTRIFEFDLHEGDSVIVKTVEKNLPLIVRRDKEIIVNFDILATQAFHFVDSKRPIYTYIPGFNPQRVPTAIHCPLSNFIHLLFSSWGIDVVRNYGLR